MKLSSVARRLGKLVLPGAIWHRMRLWRAERYRRGVAVEFIKRMAQGDSDVATPMDRHIIAAVESFSIGTMLEVGTGGGRLMHQLVRDGWNVTGIEPYDWYRDLVNDFFSTQSGIDQLIVDGDIHDLQYSDNSFDVVISNEVIEHIDDPKRGVAEIARCAKSGFVITTPYGHEKDSPDHVNHFYESDIEELFGPYSHESTIVLDRPGGNKTWLVIGHSVEG